MLTRCYDQLYYETRLLIDNVHRQLIWAAVADAVLQRGNVPTKPCLSGKPGWARLDSIITGSEKAIN